MGVKVGAVPERGAYHYFEESDSDEDSIEDLVEDSEPRI
jgi:hypothetical protein